MSDPLVSLLSDQTLFRQGISELLRRQGFHHVSAFANSPRLRAAAAHRPPAVVIVDLDHEREDTLAIVRALRHELPHASFLAIGTAPRQAAIGAAAHEIVETPDATALDLGAAAKGRERPRTVAQIRELRRWRQVTERQRDVMRWLAIGLDNGAIARKLRVGERAVKAHITHLLETFHLENRTQLALLAAEAGLRPPAYRPARG